MQADKTEDAVATPVSTGAGPQPAEVSPPPAPPERASILASRSAVLVALGYTPLLVAFGLNLWGREPYQFFPLAVAGAVFLAWTRVKGHPKPLVSGTPFVAVPLLLVAFLLLAAAAVLWSPWLGAISAFVCLVGGVWWLGGWNLFKAVLPAGLLLLTIIPPPLNFDEKVTLVLRGLAVKGSSNVLDLLRVTHVVAGNVIEIPGRRLLVEEACSGINSVLSTSAACLFYLLLRRRSVVHIVLSLVMTVSFVLLGNVARITTGAWLNVHYHIDILSGWRHQTVGLILFASYVVLILSFDQLLVFLTERSKPETAPASSPAPTTAAAGAPPKRTRAGVSSKWAWGMAAAFALMGLVGASQGWKKYAQAKAEKAIPEPALRAGATFKMPEQIGTWRRLQSELPTLQKVETRGVFSQIWHYQSGGLIASLALDYPFRGYYDVAVCYQSQGWTILQARPHPTDQAAGKLPYVEALMEKDWLQHGAVWYSMVDENGRWLDGPLFRQSFKDRLKIASGEPTTYRVQVLVTGFQPLGPADREQVQKFFEEAREMLARQLLDQVQRK